MIYIDIYSTQAVIRSQEPLTVGLVGGQAHFRFSDRWKNLTKTVVFRQGNITVDAVGVTSGAVIPWEVLKTPGMPVSIGVYGSDDTGKIIMPTVWVKTNPVLEGADPMVDASTDPTLPVYQQIQAQVYKNTPLVVEISGNSQTGYQAEPGWNDIRSAWNAGRPITAEHEGRMLPLVWMDTGLAEFCSVSDGVAFSASVTATDVIYKTWKGANDATVEALGKTVADHTGRIDGHTTQLNQLRAADNTHDTKLAELQKTATQHTIKLNAQQNAIDGHTQRLVALEAGGVGGTPGADGVSCTHRWEGTTLVVTSASGTSAANLKGETGKTGPAGKDGSDYVLTEADREEIAAIAAIMIREDRLLGTVDANHNILLSGSLASGTYLLKYENADGSYTDVGTLEVGAAPEPEVVVNLIPTALDTNLTDIYNGKGYKENTRISNSSNGEKEDTAVTKNYILTGLIPLGNENDVFHIRGVSRIGYITSSYSGYISFWDANGAYISNSMVATPEAIQGTDSNGDFTITMDYSDLTVPANTAYVRFQFGEVIGDFIMTRNQLISV